MIGYQKNDQLPEKKMTQTEINILANKNIKKMFIERGVWDRCEWSGSTFMLTNAHRYPRDWYKGKPIELLWSWEHVLRLSQKIHEYMDDRSITTEEQKEKIFIKLRGK